MNENGFFFSLKWKMAILIGAIFLLLHSIFSYLIYLDAKENLALNRQNIQSRYKNIAHALTKDSFLVLEQLAELISSIETEQLKHQNVSLQISRTLNNNWTQWQLIWGLESAVLYNKKGTLLKQWGSLLKPDAASVMQVLNNELPKNQILCPDTCFQFVLIPVMVNAEIIAALGVSRSFADPIIEYQRATGSDIAILVKSSQASNNGWPYKVSALTHARQNHPIINKVSQHYSFDQLSAQIKNMTHQEKTFEISVFTINADKDSPHSPLFLVIDDISHEIHAINTYIQSLWIYGVSGLILSLLFLMLVLIFSLRRVTRLSNALPLLAQQRFSCFRKQFSNMPRLSAAHDELDILSHTAMTLADQLEGLENNIKRSIQKLIEQGHELTAERDFVQQLINVAPILVLTQDANGRILSINRAGIDEFFLDEHLIIGNVFDNLIPDTETEHIAQLKKFRQGKQTEHLMIDGILLVSPTQKRHISWIHSSFKLHKNQQEIITLSLGVDISKRKRKEIQMQKMATKDPLTGLGNRHNFQLEFSREMSFAKRYNRQLALFYLDLDHFKRVTDTRGHKAGDKLLNLVSSTIKDLVRETDILSRIGGDEFTLIMPNADKEGIAQVANKINERLMSLDFFMGDINYKTSSSIGIAIYPQHGKDMEELLSNADLAMYQAKKSGGGQYHLFSAE